jgi:uncharacterized oxidoreductase
MKVKDNTVLITGGTAGIGLAIAQALDALGNKVIITGRDEIKLKKAVSGLKNGIAIVSDVTKIEDSERLIDMVIKKFPGLNMLINNAGRAVVYKLDDRDAFAEEKAADEMETNYFAIIRLCEALIPLLKSKQEAAIINVSSISAFVPSHVLPTYSASKAALHSYTQSLRVTLSRSSNIKVVELMPPLVDTDFSSGIGGEKGIKPAMVAVDLLNGLEKDIEEIHVGDTAILYKLNKISPREALQRMNP